MFCQVWICGLKNKTKKVGTLELERGGEKMDGWGETGRGPDHKE